MDVRLHIGAHKTATTTLQKALNKRFSVSLERKLGLVTPLQLRGKNRIHIYRYQDGSSKKLRKLTESARVLNGIMDSFSKQKVNAVGISDETLMGAISRTFVSHELYPDLQLSLDFLLEWLDGFTPNFCVTVREYGNYFAAAYETALRNGNPCELEFGDREKLVRSTRGWPTILREIQTYFPNSQISVFAYEQDSFLENVAKYLTFGRLHFTSELSESWHMVGFPGEGVEILRKVMREARVIDGAELEYLTQEVLNGHTKPKFNPWSEVQSALFRKRYWEDLLQISEMPNVILNGMPRKDFPSR